LLWLLYVLALGNEARNANVEIGRQGAGGKAVVEDCKKVFKALVAG
jgi:hypothetical protein